MNIKTLHFIAGAQQATGVAVVIDVFRAFTTEAYLARQGAKKIIPVADINLAYEYKRQNPHRILIGERHGVMLPGFDWGNSPSQISNIDFSDKTIVHTTSAGTQGLVNAINAQCVLSGSLVNAAAIAKFILKKHFDTVSLVCMGLEGLSQTEEDNLCAVYIENLLHGKKINIKSEIENLKKTTGAKFFDKAQNHIFPKEDFFCCTDVDKFNFVLKLQKDDQGLNYMKKIDIF
jgi:2-phosphosulfolactate phosphatase